MKVARARNVVAGLLGYLVFAGSASAHIASNSFIDARITGRDITGSVELAVRDVELAVGVDTDGDGKVTWGELRSRAPEIAHYLRDHVAFLVQDKPCDLDFQPPRVNDRIDGNYVWLPFTARCAGPVGELAIRYTVMEDIDPSHRGLLSLTAGTVTQTGVLGGKSFETAFSIVAPSQWRAFVEYFRAGVWHILSGIDHLLFLISLLLPAVLLRRQGEWEPVSRARPALVSIFKVVTAFTLAHSITLSLAAFGVVRLPSRLTESVIAASIVVAALNNIWPLVTRSRAWIAFAFGLLHGFGFASVLADMGLPSGARVISLLAFNCGIETGQMAVVLTVMPIIYGLRSGVFYRRLVMPWGSAAIAGLALVWLVQRVNPNLY